MNLKPAITYRDRRHWSLDIGRFGAYRWCPGAPCHLPGVARQRHWPRVTWERRP